MEITAAHRIAPSAYGGGFSGLEPGGPSQTSEIRERILSQVERIQELQRKVRDQIDRGSVGILGFSQANEALEQAKQQIAANPEQAKAAQSRGLTSIGTFGVSFA